MGACQSWEGAVMCGIELLKVLLSNCMWLRVIQDACFGVLGMRES